METGNPETKTNPTPPMNPWEEENRTQHSGRKVIGIILLLFGVILLLSNLTDFVPPALLNWPVLLILLGVGLSIRSKLRSPTGPILVLVGGLYFASDLGMYIDVSAIIWPSILIIVALWLIFVKQKPKYGKKYWRNRAEFYQAKTAQPIYSDTTVEAEEVDYQESQSEPNHTRPNSSFRRPNAENLIDCTAVLGRSIKKVQSQDFQGGEITSFMGGCEIDLSECEIKEKATLDVTSVLGGVILKVPAHWVINSQISNILGGIEDKRNLPIGSLPSEKVLTLTGAVVLGGLEICN